MITQIRMTIDHTESYAILDDELSICMELPNFMLDRNRSIELNAVGMLDHPFTAMHVNGVIGSLLADEVNFYKLLIKRLHIVKPK